MCFIFFFLNGFYLENFNRKSNGNVRPGFSLKKVTNDLNSKWKLRYRIIISLFSLLECSGNCVYHLLKHKLYSYTHFLWFLTPLIPSTKRLRWSRGSVLTFGTRSRRIFQGEKILSTPSFGKKGKPFVPCRRFTACKRSLNVTWKSGIFRKNSSAISHPSSSSFHY